MPGAEDPRYLRPGGNRRVRRRRMTRSLLRSLLWCGLWLVMFVAAAAGFTAGWRLLAGEGRFPLRRVVVQGGGEVLDREIEMALAPLLGRNVVSIDLARVERAVRDHPWVRSAAVGRRLPGSILVLIAPRRVEALVLSGHGVRMVDGTGADLGRYEERFSSENHPVITGTAPGGPGGADERLMLGLEAVRRLREGAPEIAEALSTIDVSRRDRLAVTLRDFRPPIYLSPEEPLRNLDRLAVVREHLEAEGLEVDYIDLRFRGRAAVMPVREGEKRSG